MSGGDTDIPTGTTVVVTAVQGPTLVMWPLGSLKQQEPDPTLVAILQLDALTRFAESDNAKIVIPFESGGLLGAAQALRSVLGAAPSQNSGVAPAVPATAAS